MNIEDYMEYINHRFTVNLFEGQFSNEYRCSKCGDGVLTFVPEQFHKHETQESLNCRHDEDWEPDWIQYIFTACLVCKSCSENYVVSGTGHLQNEWDNEEGSIHYDIFYPKFFIPTIHIFSIPPNTPNLIANIIEASFSLAWTDYSGAGNKLRVALELIVSGLVADDTLSLGHKINAIDDELSDIREMLKAIKWLGNQSSHEAKLEEYDLAFAFKITKSILQQLYPAPDETKALMAQVQMVNYAKGSIAKK